MKKYKVEIHFMVEAENPLRAAEQAAESLEDPLIMTYKVTNRDGSGGAVLVDLDEELHDERCREEEDD